MTMLAPVRLVPVSFQIVQENRPKRFTATLNQGLGEMGSDNTEALVLEFRNGLDVLHSPRLLRIARPRNGRRLLRLGYQVSRQMLLQELEGRLDIVREPK